MDSDGALQAMPDGVLFSDWIKQQGISKSTAYKWRNELRITPDRRRRGTKVEVWLTAGQQALMERYAGELARGLTTTEALKHVGIDPMESDGGHGIVPTEPVGIQWSTPEPDVFQSPADSDGDQLDLLRARLAALRDAVDLGAPLTSSEVGLLLGARPGRNEVVRGRLKAIRHRRNVWTIEGE
jgi:hypothetical protein